ncbi:DUF58 domain-containing protein [Lutimonas halocynthiae]|uniref:DUF58 domain-containing protein n=1 Tax=Lutimonas halocynthiae TaxID=1446477 RepID=UPI0025B51C50|nr:DUF58 domain-containing protein [Lutimonas halocynthiae]MDN3642034.1 DUF58 domain-containing protein [Lutimonas halocynthiae]
MADSKKYPSNIFVSLNDLLKMEHLSRGFSFLASKQKVRSILGGKHASKLRGRGLDFEEVRNYVPGDDIRNIDWKVTARTQKTHTRVYSEEKEKPALIIVDQSKSMFFGSQKKTKSVVAAEIAALTAFKVLKEGDRVGGVVFADNGIDIIYPKRDRKNILRFLEKIVTRNRELIDSEPMEFDKALNTVLSKVKNIVTHDFLVVIISDFHRYNPDLIKFISRLSLHNDVILTKVYDPMEKMIPETKIIAGDTKRQLLLDGAERKLRDRFENTFNDDFEKFKEQMKKHRIPVTSIDTVKDTDVQLKELFKSNKR